MFCSKCGSEVKNNSKFCSNCGNSLVVNNNQNLNNNNSLKSSNSLAIASLIIGIGVVMLSFIFNVFIFPLAITGLILGIVNKDNCGQKIAGIILNSLGMVISIIVIILASFLLISLNDFWTSEFDYEVNTNPVIGVWNCKSFNNSKEGDEYIITIKLNDDDSFIWRKYGDEYNDYVYGSYSYSDLKKTNNSDNYEYYTIDLYGQKIVSDGILQTEEYTSQYEMGINKKLGQAIFMNAYSYDRYYCYLEF